MVFSPNQVTGANSRPASPFERRRLRRRTLVVESHGRYDGGAAVAQFVRLLRTHDNGHDTNK